jgi:15-cis-phytoene synthase
MRLQGIMFLHIDELTPPRRLALAYAKGQNRAVLTLLLLHDVKLGQIIKNGKEPLIGQMRLQWWRDVITKPAAQRPSGEPLLAALGQLEHAVDAGELTSAMLKNIDAWDMLLANADWTGPVLVAHAEARGDAIFMAYARLAQLADRHYPALRQAGQNWALADLAGHCQTQEQYDAVSDRLKSKNEAQRLPRAMRPLSVLSFAARQHKISIGSGMRLILHGLTGV